MRQGLKVKRMVDRISAVVFLAVLGLAVLVLAMSLAHPGKVSSEAFENPTTSAYLKVTIAPGDTLWGLARQYYPDVDPRLATQAIQNLNGLADAVIYPGQAIALPILGGDLATQMAMASDAY